MGMFLSYGGLGRDIFEAANAWVRHVRGGMAMATIVAVAAWSAISGSATATAATIGQIVLPEMKKRGYNDSLATACVAAGATMDILIPAEFRPRSLRHTHRAVHRQAADRRHTARFPHGRPVRSRDIHKGKA